MMFTTADRKPVVAGLDIEDLLDWRGVYDICSLCPLPLVVVLSPALLTKQGLTMSVSDCSRGSKAGVHKVRLFQTEFVWEIAWEDKNHEPRERDDRMC